jgi:hypothetical protein
MMFKNKISLYVCKNAETVETKKKLPNFNSVQKTNK